MTETPRQKKRLTRQDLENHIGSWVVAGETLNFRNSQGGGGSLHLPQGKQFKITQYDTGLRRLTIELEGGVIVGLGAGCFPEDGIDIEE